jgi:2'-5' RNA ligase
MNDSSARLFLGLELNDAARNALAAVNTRLNTPDFRAKLYTPSKFHLTLCFLGNTPRARICELQSLMDATSCTPFSLTLSALGSFKNGSILWAGVEQCDCLFDYRSRLADALTAAGFPLEAGEYRPHITLGRQVKSPIPEIAVPKISFNIAHATLFESTRINDVLTYVPLYRSVFHEQ